MRIAGIATVALVLAACAGGGTQSATDTDAALGDEAGQHSGARAGGKDQVVCRMEALTGTRMKKEVCRTVSDMERDEEDAERALRQAKPLPEKGS